MFDEFLAVAVAAALDVEEIQAVLQLLQVDRGVSLDVLRLIDHLSEAVVDGERTGLLGKVDLELSVVRVGVDFGQRRNGGSNMGDGRGGREDDVVDPGAVLAAVDRHVLGVSPFQAVDAWGEREGYRFPIHLARPVAEIVVVDGEIQAVVVGLGRHFQIEADFVVGCNLKVDVEHGSLVAADLGGLGAVAAFVSAMGDDFPCVDDAAVMPVESAEVAGLETFHDLAHAKGEALFGDIVAGIDGHGQLVGNAECCALRKGEGEVYRERSVCIDGAQRERAFGAGDVGQAVIDLEDRCRGGTASVVDAGKVYGDGLAGIHATVLVALGVVNDHPGDGEGGGVQLQVEFAAPGVGAVGAGQEQLGVGQVGNAVADRQGEGALQGDGLFGVDVCEGSGVVYKGEVRGVSAQGGRDVVGRQAAHILEADVQGDGFAKVGLAVGVVGQGSSSSLH